MWKCLWFQALKKTILCGRLLSGSNVTEHREKEKSSLWVRQKCLEMFERWRCHQGEHSSIQRSAHYLRRTCTAYMFEHLSLSLSPLALYNVSKLSWNFCERVEMKWRMNFRTRRRVEKNSKKTLQSENGATHQTYYIVCM